MWKDVVNYEGLYNDEWGQLSVYTQRMKDALNKRDWSNIKDIFDIINDARKLKNTVVIDNLYKIISENDENYTKILDILRVRINECISLINTLWRLNASRKKDRWIRSKLFELNNQDIDKLKKSSLSKDIISKFWLTELPLNIFDIDDSDSPFSFLKLLKIELENDINWIEKYKNTNTKKPRERFLWVFFK